MLRISLPIFQSYAKLLICWKYNYWIKRETMKVTWKQNYGMFVYSHNINVWMCYFCMKPGWIKVEPATLICAQETLWSTTRSQGSRIYCVYLIQRLVWRTLDTFSPIFDSLPVYILRNWLSFLFVYFASKSSPVNKYVEYLIFLTLSNQFLVQKCIVLHI